MNLRTIRYSKQVPSLRQLTYLNLRDKESAGSYWSPSLSQSHLSFHRLCYTPALVEDAEPSSLILPDLSSASCPKALATALFNAIRCTCMVCSNGTG